MTKLIEFATTMRAARLTETLNLAGIPARMIQPKWKNKALPPPRIQVEVAEEFIDRAKAILESF